MMIFRDDGSRLHPHQKKLKYFSTYILITEPSDSDYNDYYRHHRIRQRRH